MCTFMYRGEKKKEEENLKMEKKTAVKKSNIFFGFMLFVNINNQIVCSAYRSGSTLCIMHNLYSMYVTLAQNVCYRYSFVLRNRLNIAFEHIHHLFE